MNRIGSFEKLGLVIPREERIRKPHEPRTMERLCVLGPGIIILAGQRGSGKSTTVGAILNFLNERTGFQIFHEHSRFSVGEEPPDIILVGELRDRESFESAAHAAETGRLVFATIDAHNAVGAIGGILQSFPANMHTTIRQTMASNVKAIICQKLLPCIKPGKQLCPALEIMIVNPVIRDLIVKSEDKKIPDAIRISYQEGMIDFNEHLRQLVEAGEIDQATADKALSND